MGRELIAVVILAACGGGQAPAAETHAASEANTAAPEAGTEPFRVEVAPPASCVAGSACEARIELTALGAYKVNEEYPFRFVADADLAVPVDGGSFELTGAKTGTMTVRLRPAAAGSERVTGVFKLSVCTPDKCEIEEPKIAFDLQVSPGS